MAETSLAGDGADLRSRCVGKHPHGTHPHPSGIEGLGNGRQGLGHQVAGRLGHADKAEVGGTVASDRQGLIDLGNAADLDPHVNSVEHSVEGVPGDFYNP